MQRLYNTRGALSERPMGCLEYYKRLCIDKVRVIARYFCLFKSVRMYAFALYRVYIM